MKEKYNPDACCGIDCMEYDEKRPERCWGDVELTGGDEALYDEDDNVVDYSPWEHHCQAHKHLVGY